jgi:ATP-binding cassette subfamily B protein
MPKVWLGILKLYLYFLFFMKSIFLNFPYCILMRATWQYMRGYRRSYVLGLILLISAIGIALLEPYLMGRLFEVIQTGLDKDATIRKAFFIILLIFLLEPIGWLFHGPGRVIELQAGFFAQQNFVQNMYYKLQNIPYAWHQNVHSGQLFDRIRKSEAALNNFTSNQFRYLDLAFNFLGSALALTLIFPWFGITCMGFVGACLVIILKFDKRLVRLYTQINTLTHYYAGIFSDYVANIRTIITLRLGLSTETELLQRYKERRPLIWKEIRTNECKWAFITISAKFLTSGLIAIGIYNLPFGNTVKFGSLVMLIQYLGKFSNVFYHIGQQYQEIVKAAADFTSTHIIEEAYEDHIPLAKKASKYIHKKQWSTIGIRNLSFAYRDSENKPHAIQAISFDIKKGEKIALVGSSGSGKSTLMTLLRGLYRAEGGQLEIDGNTMDLHALVSQTVLIPQDPEIFENTIRYNITFGIDHNEESIAKSCHIAGFDTVLAQLPQGMETDIREKGVNLSGGQKQRLALARGIFAIQNSSLILLDEPTSSVDTITEIKIFNRLFNEFHDKAMIASVHRLHLLSSFDRVIVMDEGKIIEQGPLNLLIQKNGFLAKIWHEYQKSSTVN